MHRILLRHTYVVIFLQLFSLIDSFHLIRLIIFNTADLLITVPLIFQHRYWSSNNIVDFPIIQSIFQHNNWSSNDTVDLQIIQSIFCYNNKVDLLVKHRNYNPVDLLLEALKLQLSTTIVIQHKITIPTTIISWQRQLVSGSMSVPVIQGGWPQQLLPPGRMCWRPMSIMYCKVLPASAETDGRTDGQTDKPKT